MIGIRPSQILAMLGAILTLAGGPAIAHQVTRVRADPALPVVDEPVTLTVAGYFNDGCERTTSVTAQAAEHRIVISVLVVGPAPGVGCPEVITPFEQAVQVAGLAADNYRIDVQLLIHEFGQQWTESFPDVGELFVHRGKLRYQLGPESWFMNDCPICDRIPVKLPMTGAFDLLPIGPGNVFDFYDVGAVKFHAEGYQVTAQGRYQKSDPWIAGLQYMNLDTAVNNETGLVLDSDFIAFNGSGMLPRIDIELAEVTSSLVRVYRMRIVAAPLLPYPDFDGDTDVDRDDLAAFEACTTGPAIPYNPAALPPGCTLAPDGNGKIAADFDEDDDVDQSDFSIFQRCYSGEDVADPNCAN